MGFWVAATVVNWPPPLSPCGRILCSRPTVTSASSPYSTACYLLAELLELGDVQSPQGRESLLEERFEGTELFDSLSLLNNLLGIQVGLGPLRDLTLACLGKDHARFRSGGQDQFASVDAMRGQIWIRSWKLT